MKHVFLTNAIAALMLSAAPAVASADPVEGCDIPEIEITHMPSLPIGETWILSGLRTPNRVPINLGEADPMDALTKP